MRCRYGLTDRQLGDGPEDDDLSRLSFGGNAGGQVHRHPADVSVGPTFDLADVDADAELDAELPNVIDESSPGGAGVTRTWTSAFRSRWAAAPPRRSTARHPG